MCARQKLEHSVGLEVAVRVIGVVIEGETQLTGTEGVGGLGRCDIILSGPTEREDWNHHQQQLDTHSHCCIKKKNPFNLLLDFICSL